MDSSSVDESGGSACGATEDQSSAGSRGGRIAEALRAVSYRQDGEWYEGKPFFATKPRALLDEAADKIEGLEADLRLAVQVAFRRGAIEWTRLNYPEWHAHFMAEFMASRETCTVVVERAQSSEEQSSQSVAKQPACTLLKMTNPLLQERET